jgi:hypothetical protein
MQRMYLNLRGPIQRPLWNRLRRRLVQGSSAATIAAAVGAGALYATAAAEPSLSGAWVRDDGVELRLFHIGRWVTGTFANNDSVSFVAHFSSRTRLDGYIYVSWRDEDMRIACGRAPWPDHTFSASVGSSYEFMQFRWTNRRGDRATCATTSTEVTINSMRKKTDF